MQTTHKSSRWIELQRRHRTPFDCIAMLFYLLLVHVWGLGAWPLGRDYEVLAQGGSWLSPMASTFLGAQVRLFGGNPLPYQAINLVLLYCAMLCVYFLVNRILVAPRWFGTLAAALFMAHPVHLEAAMNVVGGAMDLLPPLLGLLMLALLLRGADTSSVLMLAVGAAAGVVALWVDPANITVVAVLALHLWLNPRRDGRRRPQAAWAAVAMLALWGVVFLPGTWAAPVELALWAAFTLIYPLGLLPETTHRLVEHPWMFLAAVSISAALLVLVYTKVRKPGMILGVAGALLASFAMRGRPFDPYHLVGGGQLVLAAAFAMLAVCAVFARIFEHPKWRRPVIYVTTAMCVVLFGMKISGIVFWRQAGAEVREFQQAAAALPAGEMAAVVPDWQHWNGAPLQLGKSIAYDTPFSSSRPLMRMLPLNRPNEREVQAEIRIWREGEAVVAISSGDAMKLAPFPYALTAPGAAQDAELASVTLLEAYPTETIYRIDMLEELLPAHVLPARMATNPDEPVAR